MVEVLLAATMFGMMVTALAGAIVFGRVSQATAGDQSRAIMIAQEGLEATRNIRDASFSNLTDGTFGIAQSGNQWVFSGGSDVGGMFTRQVTVASNGASRKNITSTVSWQESGSTNTVSVSSQLTNWMASLIKQWSLATQQGTYNAASTNDAIKVATQGNYAYVVRNDGTPDFLIINISNPAAPTLTGSLSLAGVPTNIAVSGNYAYVTNTSDTAEMQVINVTTPASPSLVASFNAAGASDGAGVFIAGNIAYLTRKANAANNEFVAINVVTPAAPTRVGWYNLNVNMNEVYVNGSNVFIATDSDTQEIIKITNALAGQVTTVTSFNLAGTNNATTITGFGNTLLVGQSTLLNILNDVTSLTGTATISGVVNDIAVNAAQTYAFLATAASAAEFQVVSISNLSSPIVSRTLDIGGGATTSMGVAFNPLDLAIAVGNSDTQEVTVFGPG